MENIKMTILHRGKTEEEVMEILDNNNIKYEFNFSINSCNTSIVFISHGITYVYCFEDGKCIKVLTNK